MKKIFLILSILLFIMSSCGSSGSKNEGANNDAEKATTIESVSDETEDAAETDFSGVDKCTKFLDDYEIWANDYIKLLEKFTTNPADSRLAQDYNKLNREYKTWTNEWFEFSDCVDESSYLTRYNKINWEIEQKQKELRGV